MTKAPVIRFPGNPKPTVRRGNGSATIIILPMIRIERFVVPPRRPQGAKRRRKE